MRQPRVSRLLPAVVLLVGVLVAVQLLSRERKHPESKPDLLWGTELLHQIRPRENSLSPSSSRLVSAYLDRRYEGLAGLAQSPPLPLEEILIGNSFALSRRWAQAVPHYQKVPPGPYRADARSDLALALLASNQLKDAIGAALEALSADQKGDPSNQAVDLATLGTIAFRLGDLVKAKGAHQSALRLAVQAQNTWQEAMERLSLGSLANLEQQPHLALEEEKSALHLFHEAGDPLGEVQTLAALGLVYKGAGQADQALESFQEAQRISREIGDRESEGTAWIDVALLEQERGRYASALAAGGKAVELAARGDSPLQRAAALGSLAMVQKNAGHLTEALQSLEEARSLFQSAGSSEEVHGVEIQIKAIRDQISPSP